MQILLFCGLGVTLMDNTNNDINVNKRYADRKKQHLYGQMYQHLVSCTSSVFQL
jgi:hypothetical protein